MGFSFSHIGFTIQSLVLSWTPYYSMLCKATEPEDYDQVLERITSDVKFHCETLLSILFYMGTVQSRKPLISWTLACLLYNLLTYSALDAMTGEVLQENFEHKAAGKLIVACLSKLPAISVIATLFFLALMSWHSYLTLVVLGILTLIIVVKIVISLQACGMPERLWRWCFTYVGVSLLRFVPKRKLKTAVDGSASVPAISPAEQV